MDPIKILKFKAMHKHNKRHHQPFNTLFLYTLTALTCSLFCFSPLWLPSLTSSMKAFVFVSVPKISSLFLSSKFVFILGNLIVVALVGESKIFSTVSSASNIVDQYESMKRCQTLQSSSTHHQKEPKNLSTYVEEKVLLKRTCGDEEAIEGKGWDEESEEVVVKVKEDIDEDEDEDDDDDDDQKLNQRADDFIARVTERRLFELELDNCFCNSEK
ncbi:hypothetical protein PRUPE_5G148200 [Prunus persica]|uniref:DUF4408 domain-containing protein n=1 Tax=Prunus persica TaxID=3760 RepID=M5WC93_PRUPE|nr:histone chaperone RTT106 [Prunus persica]ONI07935.1 hypothetical protein PRUPE_5G148200 [Prunus persica]